MILIIPEIKIIDGVCSFCIKGDEGMHDFYEHLSNYPNELCKLLRVENSKSIFVNDVDSFLSKSHHVNFDAILELAKTIDSPFQVMTNFKTFDECTYLITNKIRKIIIKDTLFRDPKLVKSLIDEYSASFFAFYVSEDNYYIDDTKEIHYSAKEMIKIISSIGGNRIFYSNPNWNKNMTGILKDDIIQYAHTLKMKVTLINGIYNSNQLLDLEKLTEFGVDSIVLGESLFNNYFPCQNLWRMIEANNKNLELMPVKH